MDLIDPSDLPADHSPVACPLYGGIVSSFPAMRFSLKEYPVVGTNADVTRIAQILHDMLNTVIRDHIAREHPDEVHRAPPQYR